MRRTNGFVGAIAADEPGVRSELTGANIRGSLLHDLLCLVELLSVARGYLPLVVLQVVKNQPHGIPFKNFFRRQRIETELQIIFRILILPGPSSYVLQNPYVVAASP